MENEIEIPDFVAKFAGKGFETKPGIQFAGGIRSTQLKRGERTYLMFVLQNALDVPVYGEISVELPSSRWFKKTNLSTISPVEFSLEGTEVEKLEIPIQTSVETPEGEYEVKIRVNGKGGKGGQRVRGKKRGKDYGKAVAKSIAESVAVSAVGLLFGGVGVCIHTPSDWMKTTFVVKGEAPSTDTSTLEVIRQKLWYETYSKFYSDIMRWTNKCLENWNSDRELQRCVIEFFVDELNTLFKSKGVNMSEEELLWLGNLMTHLTFSWGLIRLYNVPMYPLKRIADLHGEKWVLEHEAWSKELNFKKDVIEPWFADMKEDAILKHFSLTGALIAMRLAESKGEKTGKGFVQYFIRTISEPFKKEKTTPSEVMQLIHIYFSSAIFLSRTFFPKKEEAINHLELLAEAISVNKAIEEGFRQTLSNLIEKQKESIAQIRTKGK